MICRLTLSPASAGIGGLRTSALGVSSAQAPSPSSPFHAMLRRARRRIVGRLASIRGPDLARRLSSMRADRSRKAAASISSRRISNLLEISIRPQFYIGESCHAFLILTSLFHVLALTRRAEKQYVRRSLQAMGDRTAMITRFAAYGSSMRHKAGFICPLKYASACSISGSSRTSVWAILKIGQLSELIFRAGRLAFRGR